jgi:hypothetical protein
VLLLAAAVGGCGAAERPPGGGSGLLLTDVRPGHTHSGDVCFRLALDRQARAPADEYCAVRDPHGGVAELRPSKRVPEGAGPPVSIVAGHAGPRVRKLLLEVEGRSHELPLSAGRGFLAVLPRWYAGRLALVARRADGTVATHSFALPRPRMSRRRLP